MTTTEKLSWSLACREAAFRASMNAAIENRKQLEALLEWKFWTVDYYSGKIKAWHRVQDLMTELADRMES